MSSRSRKLALPILAITIMLSSVPSFAADTVSEAQWLINLVSQNDGKAFCLPENATLNDVSYANVKFSKEHPELHDHLTDRQVIQGIAESYPCAAVTNTPTPNLNTKNVEVAPKGEFSSIDTKPTMAIMQRLSSTTGHENDDLVNQIVKNPGNYMPPIFFALANLFYRQGDIDNAIFWFNAARLRGSFDADICTDVTARSAISGLVQQIPTDLRKKQFDDIPKLKNITARVLKWDEITPYNYDHRWISLHGMNAINSGLGNAASTAPLTVPRENWAALAQKNRDQYRASLDSAIDMVQKQRANTNPLPTGS
ncbi:hypothetical protein [Glaciimonas soli]|uniref:Tetratricopeptide repeat protein n=1 Tax=Glaciimonas soli TaxID=2590999 RepID=A0A843YPE9_9BURK|nr:hypothetical protein [Glaciimonas soli]MQR01365.1 hypothetical protein [Glaciimonas soli]